MLNLSTLAKHFCLSVFLILFFTSNISSQCFTNDLCSEATDISIQGGDTNCLTACNTGTGIDVTNGSGCYDFSNLPTVWFSFTTDNNTDFVNLDLVSPDINIMQVAIYQGDCNNFIPIDCTIGNGGSANLHTVNVSPNNQYLIAIGSFGGETGDFNICLTTIPSGGTACNTNTEFNVINTSLGSPFSGPFQPAEEVTVCVDVNYTSTGNNCQWLHGFVPTFGEGWDPISFNTDGSPVNAILPSVGGGGIWNWYQDGDVLYNDIPGGSHAPGAAVGAGWFVVGVNNNGNLPAQCGPNDWISDPNCSFGAPIGCNTNASYQFCMTLTTLSSPECSNDPLNTDCGIDIRTFADGETGGWGSVGCELDIPLSANYSLSCCDAPQLLPVPQTAISNVPLQILLDDFLLPPFVPGEALYTWTVTAPAGVDGANSCGLSCGNTIMDTLINTTGIPQIVTYTITPQSLSACNGGEIELVINLSALELSISDPGLICFGDCATLSPTVLGGQPPYTYQWNTNENTETITVCPNVSESYCLTVSDGNQNSAISCYDLQVNPTLQLEDVVITNASNANGSIFVSISGGTLPHDYLWSNGSTDSNNTGLDTGDYSLTVSDANACTSVFGPFMISGSIIQLNKTDVDCNGNANGSIDIDMLGGSIPFTYSWVGPNNFTSTDADLSNLAGGNYALTVTDGQSINYTIETVIFEPAALDININTEVIACFGGVTSVDYLISGGSTPYQLDWNGLDPNNAPVGNYQLVVTDANNCTGEQSFSIEENPLLTLSLTVQDEDCNQSNGCVSLEIDGGEEPYIIEWSTGSNETSICTLAVGTYSVTVTDGNNCTAEKSASVNLVDGPMVTFDYSPVVCNTEGYIDLTIEGPFAPYDFDWSDGATEEDRTNLSFGEYTITVYDTTACTVAKTFILESAVEFSLESTPAQCDSTGGTATATQTGVGANLLFEWSTGDTGSMISNVVPGGYSLTVTDDNGCRRHDNILVPLDSACFVTIAGTIYLEENNQDCIPDSAAQGVANMLVWLDVNHSTFTDAQGNYSFNVNPGIYQVSLLPNNPSYDLLCSGPITVDVSGVNEVSAGNDFFVELPPNNDLKIYINKGNARPGFDQNIRICLFNHGAEPASGSVIFRHDSIQQFISASPIQDNYDATTNTITWNFTDLPPGGSLIVFNATMSIDQTVPLGTILSMYFEANPIIDDLSPLNNVKYCEQVVTGSYDPNDKQVDPPGVGETGDVYDLNAELSYLIRFQNTGTDTAFTVVIKDTLSTNLDLETVLPGASSHPYEVTFEEERVLVFTFNDIYLPDSLVNEPESHGWVFFDVKVKEGLTYGDEVLNSAAIYFDYNPPVITNVIQTTLALESVATHDIDKESLNIQVQPNPTNEFFSLSYELEENQKVSIEAFNAQGKLQTVLQRSLAQNAGVYQPVFSTATWPTGVYFLKVKTTDKLGGTVRLVKAK